MFSRKSFSALLTGASLAALAASTGRAAAGTTTTINQPVFNWVTNTDWLNIDSTSSIGTFTNSATIAFGLGNPDGTGAVGVSVRDGASIGVFVNGGGIFASDNGQPGVGNTITTDASAVGLLIDGVVPTTTNNGSIGALAFGYDSGVGAEEAEAFGTGVLFDLIGPGSGTVADLNNNGSILANSTAQAMSTGGMADAEAGAFGIYVDFADQDAAVSSTIVNSDTLGAASRAEAVGTLDADADAEGDGVSQDFDNVDSGSAAFTNDGAVSFSASASATSTSGVAGSEADADGIDQEIEVDESAGLSAVVTATNSGTLAVNGSANSVATTGAAYAGVDSAGFEQDAIGGKTLSSVSATNLGEVSVLSSAGVSLGTGTYVGAFAEASGFEQYVTGGNTTPLALNASAFADNQGAMSVTAMSSSSGTFVEDGPAAFADAVGIEQEVENAAVLSAVANNSSSLDVLAGASSSFVSATYIASGAFAGGVTQDLDNNDDVGGIGGAIFTNTGSLTVRATSTSSLGSFFYAASYGIGFGVEQGVYDVETGSASFQNDASGTIAVSIDSTANGAVAISDAGSVGVGQSVYTTGDVESANLTATNLGQITVDNVGQANGTYVAAASGIALGIAQSAGSDSATASATNSGTLDVNIQTTANAVPGVLDAPAHIAFAYSTYAAGIAQSIDADEFGAASATNSGSISLMAGANASAATYAASISPAFGVIQDVDALAASAAFSNSGVLSVTSSTQSLSDRIAISYAVGVGVDQSVEADFSEDFYSSAVASVVNDDTIVAGADAVAGGLNAAQATYAIAVGFSRGVAQDVSDATMGAASLTNSGTVAAVSTSSATGTVAFAAASATGYEASFGDLGTGSAYLRNMSTGGIWASAEAEANGADTTLAVAEARGVSLTADFGIDGLGIDAISGGLIAASAVATTTGNGIDENAIAQAVGVEMYSDGLLSGSFKNGSSGVIAASAMATSPNSIARAVGVDASSGENSMMIVNKGLISAYAEGRDAMATGIRIAVMDPFVTITTSGPPPAEPLLPSATIENHGDIWAGISTDGGDTVLRGNAINTQDAPNAVTILLENNDPANIFGNIQISADDQIIVKNGTTKFDGVINPDMVLEGGLKIGSGGKLVMLNDNNVEGPSMAYVDVFEMGKNGTLQLNLTPDNSPGAYPTITANTATLKGKFKAQYTNGLYANKTIYENVIDAGSRTGKFDQVADNSLLLKTKLIYDSDDNVDIKAKRVAFGDVDGLTQNQKSAANGIEKVYGDLPNNGPFSNIVKDLFTLDGAQYAAAMDQLAGAEYAQLMQSVLHSTGQLNASITDRMDCSVETNVLAQGADARKGCFDPNKVQVWARVGGAWNNADGDVEAPGYDETQTSIYIGGDYAINTNVFIGAVGGYFNSSMDFDDWGGRNGASMNYDGGQIALYGGYDDGVWYGRNILSYGFYSGDSRRDFGITSAPMALKGSYDTDVVSYYGEAGRRFQVMEQVAATPFLGLGLASAGIGSFTEKDPNNTGAALRIRGADSSSVATTLGFRVNGHWGGFRPEATLAWQHEFADARQTVDMSYAGAPNGGNFSVVSADPGSDALLVGVGGSYSVTQSSVITLRYDGAFWSGLNSQQLTARWTSKF